MVPVAYKYMLNWFLYFVFIDIYDIYFFDIYILCCTKNTLCRKKIKDVVLHVTNFFRNDTP